MAGSLKYATARTGRHGPLDRLSPWATGNEDSVDRNAHPGQAPAGPSSPSRAWGPSQRTAALELARRWIRAGLRGDFLGQCEALLGLAVLSYRMEERRFPFAPARGLRLCGPAAVFYLEAGLPEPPMPQRHRTPRSSLLVVGVG